MRHIILLTVFVFTTTYGFSQSILETAEKYLEAYQNLDFKTMETFYHEDAQFIDPTYYIVDKKGFHIKGKKNIIETLTKGFQGTLKWKLVIQNKFVNGKFVVVSGKINSKVEGKNWGRPDKKELVLEHSFVTVLKFEKKKIKEHKDYIDYITAGKQITSQ